MKKTLLVLAVLAMSFPARAQTSPFSGVPSLETTAKQAIIMEAAGNTVLYEKNADEKMPTSSMSKVMTMILVFDAIRKGKLALDTQVTVSEAAWKQPGSRTFLKIGQRVGLEDLVRGVIVQSGNDAAVALAEAVAGSEGAFAGLMNEKAREMGLAGTRFMNATGLPDPDHYSTARDLAFLALSLIRDFPEFYHYYSEKEFLFNGIKQGNRNPLLYRDGGVDGVKTGHTEEAGYGLISSAFRDGRRVIAVINGVASMQARADESAKLLDWAYREFGLYPLLKTETKLADAKVWLGESKNVAVGAAKNLDLAVPRMQREQVKIELFANAETEAPIQKGQGLGRIVVTAPGHKQIDVPLVALEDVKRLGFFAGLVARAKRLMGKE